MHWELSGRQVEYICKQNHMHSRTPFVALNTHVANMQMAEARLAVLSGNLAAAAEALGQAAVVEGSGGYYEPPRLGPQPARQCLGWVLLRAGRLREALQVDGWGENGFGRMGLGRIGLGLYA